jgi:hypothetical protein
LFDEQMFLAEKKGISVVRIKSDSKPLEELAGEVRSYIERILTPL